MSITFRFCLVLLVCCILVAFVLKSRQSFDQLDEKVSYSIPHVGTAIASSLNPRQ